jgi:hypothetical protein
MERNQCAVLKGMDSATTANTPMAGGRELNQLKKRIVTLVSG